MVDILHFCWLVEVSPGGSKPFLLFSACGGPKGRPGVSNSVPLTFTPSTPLEIIECSRQLHQPTSIERWGKNK